MIPRADALRRLERVQAAIRSKEHALIVRLVDDPSQLFRAAETKPVQRSWPRVMVWLTWLALMALAVFAVMDIIRRLRGL